MDFDKETMKSLMIDHIDGKITGELARYVELHIEKNPYAKAEYEELKQVMELMDEDVKLEVPEHIKSSFLKNAAQEFKNDKGSKINELNLTIFMKIAAAVSLLVLGYLGNSWLSNKSEGEVTQLRNELMRTKELVLLSMLKQESASERLKGIMTSSEITEADDDIIDALITTMNTDRNINVRIAAADALARFSENEKARLALIASLNNQTYPAVQMKLIDILIIMGDKNALDPLKEFAENEDVLKSVRDEAHMGIFKLM